MGGLTLSDVWMEDRLRGSECGEQEEAWERELWLGCKMNKDLK